jgi:hypothetical protein
MEVNGGEVVGGFLREGEPPKPRVVNLHERGYLVK